MCSIIAQCQSHYVIEEEENLFKSQSQAHWGKKGRRGKEGEAEEWRGGGERWEGDI